MKNSHFTLALLASTVLVGACSSLPKTTSLLDQTRTDYQVAQNNPKVASYAQLEMKQAGEAMERANVAASKNVNAEEIDKLAYLAKQKIALTQEVAKQKSAEADVASAGKERDQLRLDQRTSEANQARLSAEQSRLAAKAAQDDAAIAQSKTQSAQSDASIAQGKMQEAQSDAAVAQGKMQEAQERTAKLEAQLADLTAKKTARGMVITLSDVLFGTDQARLNQNGMRTAQKLADVLLQYPQLAVLVEGFTDSTGTASHNQELSERRATAVRSALQEMGVARDRVAIRGYGEAYPVAANDTKENRQLNRRVEIVISDASGRIPPR